MDAIDRQILSELQRSGRATVTELAGRVRLSVSQVHRRVRELEGAGVIVGYRAQLDASRLGLAFESIVFVTMETAKRADLDSFEDAVARHPQIIQADRLFGEPDYLLRVVAADLPGFQQLYDDVLSLLPGVQRLRSTLVMKHVSDRPLPA